MGWSGSVEPMTLFYRVSPEEEKEGGMAHMRGVKGWLNGPYRAAHAILMMMIKIKY